MPWGLETCDSHLLESELSKWLVVVGGVSFLYCCNSPYVCTKWVLVEHCLIDRELLWSIYAYVTIRASSTVDSNNAIRTTGGAVVAVH